MRPLILATLFSTISYLSYSQNNLGGDTWNKIKANGEGKLVCLWNEAYGIVYKKDEVVKGVSVDILKDFTAYVNAKYKVAISLEFIEEKSFSSFLEKTEKTPDILGVSSVSITDERKKKFLFTPHFLINPNVLVTNRNSQSLTRLEDLSTLYNSYKVKVVEGSIHDSYAKKLRDKYYPSLVIEYASSSRIIFEEMSKNNKMFTIIDFGEYLGASRSKKDLVRQNVELGFVDKMGFIMNKKSDWGNVWNEFLTDEYRKSSSYRKIIQENLGSSYLAEMQRPQ
jgi:ABC-type amino acid transport substrate-binding protein